MVHLNQRYSESIWSVLAIMRFILAMIVLISHLNVFAPLPAFFQITHILDGKAAVLGFLAISGFSIGYSYTHKPEQYFKRRFLRIYPLYFAAVVFTIILAAYVGSNYKLYTVTLVNAGIKTSLINLFFLQGFVSITMPYNGPLWTLAIEVFLYILAPFLSRIPFMYYIFFIIVSMITFTFFDFKWLFGYKALRYAWPWLIGFMITARYKFNWALLFSLIGLICVCINTTDMSGKLCWLTYIVSVVIIFCSISYDFTISPAVRSVLNYLGDLSYPLYLFHMPLFLFLFYFFGIRNTYLFLILCGILIIPINFIFDHWLKKIFWEPLVNWFDVKVMKREKHI